METNNSIICLKNWISEV